jgi:MFS family permease
LPIYYGWVIVAVAALAMVGTLPGRTQGLGLITEPMLADLSLSRSGFATMNFWATLLGALCCLPVGRALDRFGSRVVLVFVAAGLGLTVLAMSQLATASGLLVLLILTRALGQSALSVVSISLVGKWFDRRVSMAMGLFSVMVGFLFAIAFGVVGVVIEAEGWRAAWQWVGVGLLVVLAPLAWWLVRSGPESCGLEDDVAADTKSHDDHHGMTLIDSLRTPAFWAFALATSLFGLAVSGVGLFNEAILKELGFDASTYHAILAGTALIGLVSQMLSGWAGQRWSLRSLLVVAMLLYGASMVWLPHVTTHAELWANAVLMGAAGGIITVVFFAIWPEQFGRLHLGRIQGAAQMLTVLASAIGPVLFAQSFEGTGSFAPALYGLAGTTFVAAVFTAMVRLPRQTATNS